MHIQFAELPVFDQDRAKAFYTGHLACQVAEDQLMGDSGWRWIELTSPAPSPICISSNAPMTRRALSPCWCSLMAMSRQRSRA